MAGPAERGIEPVRLPAGGLVFDALASGPAGGDLVVLLHGFPQSAEEWAAQLEVLGRAGYRAVAPDQRGYSPGARPEGVDHYRVEHLVGDVLAMADHLGATRFHVVGHDWGAVVAWHVAARHPARVRSLSAVSVPHPAAFAQALASSPSQRAKSAYITLFRQEGPAEAVLSAGGLAALFRASGHPGDYGRYLTRMAEPGALTAALNWYRAMDLSLVLGLGPVTTPTLFVWSDGDVALGREGAEATAAHVAGPYRFEVLEGVSHWVPEEAPERLNRLLLEHLAATA